MNRRSRNIARAWFASLSMCSWIIGILLITEGNHRAAQDYYYNIVPWGLWGAFFFALPFIAAGLMIVGFMLSLAATEHQRYMAWKGSLTPQHRAAVEAAEFAALATAAIGLHEHHKHVDRRLTESVMGRDPAPPPAAAGEQMDPQGLFRCPSAGFPPPDMAAFGRDGTSMRVLPGVAPHRDN
jgi:hypothetical protein